MTAYRYVDGAPQAMTAEEVAAFRAARAPVAPPPVRVVTPREFMDRLPADRQRAITAAAIASPQILLWLIRLTGALEVDLDNAETMEGVQTLAMAEVITDAEAQALLA